MPFSNKGDGGGTKLILEDDVDNKNAGAPDSDPNGVDEAAALPLFESKQSTPHKALSVCLFQCARLSGQGGTTYSSKRTEDVPEEEYQEEGGVPLAEQDSCGWHKALEKISERIADNTITEAELTAPIVRFPFDITESKDKMHIDLKFQLPIEIGNLEALLNHYESTNNKGPGIEIYIKPEKLAEYYKTVFQFIPDAYHFMPTLVELTHWSTQGIDSSMRFTFETKKPKSNDWTIWTQAYGVDSLSSTSAANRHGFVLAPNEKLNTEPKSIVCWRADPQLERYRRLHRWKAFNTESMRLFANSCADRFEHDFLSIPTGGKASCRVEHCLTYLVINALPSILYRLRYSDVKDNPKLNEFCLENAVTSDAHGSCIRCPKVVAHGLISEVEHVVDNYKNLMSFSGGARVRLLFTDSMSCQTLRNRMHDLRKQHYLEEKYNPSVRISVNLRVHCIPVTACPSDKDGHIPVKLGQLDTNVRLHVTSGMDIIAARTPLFSAGPTSLGALGQEYV